MRRTLRVVKDDEQEQRYQFEYLDGSLRTRVVVSKAFPNRSNFAS